MKTTEYCLAHKAHKRWITSLQKVIDVGRVRASIPEDAPEAKLKRCNRFSGQVVECPGSCADIRDVIVTPIELWPAGFTKKDWDHLRYLVNVVWPDIYYALID